MRWSWGVIVALACFWAGSAQAQTRWLYYRELAVTASLDEDGRLHVAERQAMVFDGDWNGGERRFRLSGAQQIAIESLTRIDAHGRAIPLVQGDLSRNDHYEFRDGDTLRWRARQPDAPPFQHTEIVYVVSYVLLNILVDEGDTYRLDHDFAFSDRPGMIERFRLDLELDPGWEPKQALKQHVVGGPLAPGMGFVVSVPLEHTGPGEPKAVLALASEPQRLGWVAALLGTVGLLFAWLFRREAKLGRFAPLLAPGRIDRRWLTQHVFALPPELVGAVHDRRVGQAEVIAVIARMVGEQKLASRVTEATPTTLAELELWLLVERASLHGHERSLVDELFFAGNSTSTSALRAHYQQTGYDPSNSLSQELEPRADALLGVPPRSLKRFVAALLLLAASSVVLFVVAGNAPGATDPPLVIGLIVYMFTTIASGLLAYNWVANVERPGPAAWTFLGPSLCGVLGFAAIILWWPALPPLSAACLTYFGISAAVIVVMVAHSRDQASGMALRKCLVSARRFFARELEKPQPLISDHSFPYLIALGLIDDMDHWFRSFGAPTKRSSLGDDWRSSSAAGSASVSIPSSSSGGQSWTGGGGAFGGAGASGSWVAATGVLASGVSSPSSSSSSSGSSSSSSRSGGGGGGGW